jgi:multiple sugar transport system substrate-binding protein
MLRKTGLKNVCTLLIVLLLLAINSLGTNAAAATKLSIWLGYPECLPVLNKAIADYQKTHPDVEIEALTFDVRELERKVAISVSANVSADIVLLDHMPGMRYVAADLFTPVSDDVGSYLKKSVPASTNALASINNQQYGLPWFIGPQVLYYNKTMFKEAGLSRPPETIDELVDYAKKLAKYDDKGNLIRSGIALRISGGGSGVGHKFAPWLYAFGGDILVKTADGKYHNGYDNEAGRNTLKFYIDILHKYKVDSILMKHDAEAFALENTAMFKREAWVVGYMNEHAPDVDYDCAPLPGQARRGTVYDAMIMYVPKASKNAELAWDFLLHLSKEEYAKMLMTTSGWIPARTDVDYSDIIAKQPQFAANVVVPEGFVFEPFPVCEAFDEILTKLATRLVTAFADKSLVDNPAQIDKTIKQMAEETDNILKRTGLYGK